MPSPPDNIIRIDSFSFSFGRKQILDDVSFNVARGESLAIVGPNGAGKTTLIKCLDALLDGVAGAIKSGTIELDGRVIADYSRKQLARLVSYVP